MKKALFIHSHGVDDMGDLLAVARAEGKRAFRTKENIRVLPLIYKDDVGNLIVLVEYDGVGLHNAPGAGDEKE